MHKRRGITREPAAASVVVRVGFASIRACDPAFFGFRCLEVPLLAFTASRRLSLVCWSRARNYSS
jgi:hypothetical protein